jgi:hypothetical protein
MLLLTSGSFGLTGLWQMLSIHRMEYLCTRCEKENTAILLCDFDFELVKLRAQTLLHGFDDFQGYLY